MIEELLPESVVAVEAHAEDMAVAAEGIELFPEEETVVARAVLKRRREFTVVRGCARRAMEKLGVAARPILPGERGAPGWPEGLTGSMTHCEGYAAAALVRSGDLASLGIDAEPHNVLPEGVLEAIALPAEEARLRRLTADHPTVHWDRLLFSAKESVYKAWFPLTGRWLDFSEADIEVTAEPGGQRGALRAELLVPGPVVKGRPLTAFDGRWIVRRGLVVTAVSVPFPTE
ncbi:4'-phosphopantetheinyl transferase superfamily protein [Streptomyces ipomoeae]|uniref:4'-phosphopantetheinyl transferase superfamily protein n=1 Tax=Streptomyces ipomoeae TaxID=103232 RepID=A0A540PZC5_9ACTN|nr:4'-phosphopantetheinyl transferase superfamily protein [Streptomyces ipomoeae]MDX2694208.1 4'-phosphopantetheinyl transferase superfamily protein [Streptomyces ipomoeae]MDX2840159.1 4'-phosphopantetheinyl transferase superfamily protein [Streptomyces ipomoeae]MDX2933398.1 4'-phosphopantetheinyl transferase superfamily protein [Streptomyces ipomoeae]TQE20325.1 4'-phosphopantetheinyl transferase superfamily protein [Streptomyces ipomoeae]TQE25671.1 4'-phosphopantetheinyl transferase superfami